MSISYKMSKSSQIWQIPQAITSQGKSSKCFPLGLPPIVYVAIKNFKPPNLQEDQNVQDLQIL